MDDTIWKFPINVVGEQDVLLPFGADILTAQVQGTAPYLWARVSTINSPEPRRIYVRGTGHQMTGDEGRYISTFRLHGGALVFHVFEARRA